jgi:uroporphyrinogen-III synthase
LFVLRPEPAAGATIERARALGLEPVAMPLFAIEPTQWDVPDPRAFDGVLLTSVNAVRHGGTGLRALHGLGAYAVGAPTAAAASESGFDVILTGGAGIEQLLGSIDPGLRLLHLCGTQHMPANASHAITTIPVYRADELPPPAQIGDIVGATAAVHSPRAARRLAELVDAAGLDRATIRIAAISRAAAQAAGSGWANCETAARPDDAALLAVAARLCDKPGQP